MATTNHHSLRVAATTTTSWLSPPGTTLKHTLATITAHHRHRRRTPPTHRGLPTDLAEDEAHARPEAEVEEGGPTTFKDTPKDVQSHVKDVCPKMVHTTNTIATQPNGAPPVQMQVTIHTPVDLPDNNRTGNAT